MALFAQQECHIAALFPSSCSSVGFASGAPDYRPSCATFRLSSSSGTTTNALTNSVLNASTGALARGQRQSGRIECSSRSYRGNCRGNFGHKILPLFSSLQGFPLPQLHLPIGFLTRSNSGFPCYEALTKLPTCRLSRKVFADVNGLPKWHWIGIVGLSGRSPLRGRANSGDGSGSSEEADEEGGETLEEVTQEVEVAQGGEDNDSEVKDEQQDADGQESPDESGKGNVKDETDDKEALAESEEAKTEFSRKIWEPGQKEEDVALDAEEELLLQDLESLSFNWKTLLDPSWDNVLALCFTALLVIALFKILFQLILVGITVFLSALKYSVLAAVLLGLLIFLL